MHGVEIWRVDAIAVPTAFFCESAGLVRDIPVRELPAPTLPGTLTVAPAAIR
jgi:hypothetical protein